MISSTTKTEESNTIAARFQENLSRLNKFQNKMIADHLFINDISKSQLNDYSKSVEHIRDEGIFLNL